MPKPTQPPSVTDNVPLADAPEARPDPLFNLSLAKGLAVLRSFDAGHRAMTLSEVAARSDMTKASAQRTVHTLEVLGYLGRQPRTGRFCLQPKALEIGYGYVASHPLALAATPYLAQLSNESGETASLTEPVELDMVYIAQRMTTQFIPVLTPVGMRIPMYCTSSGRAWLAGQSDAQVAAVLAASAREPRTPHTLTDVAAITDRIDECRRVGYAWNAEELFLGDMGIAAPIVEELIFRGYLYPIMKKYTGAWFALISSSLLFGIIHVSLVPLIPLALFGAILVLLYEYTESIWTPIIAHCIFNTATLVNILYPGLLLPYGS